MTKEIHDVPMSEILFDEDWNCRTGKLLPVQVRDLMESIPQVGLLQPVIVSPWDKDGYKYKLIIGFRRYKAMSLLNKETIKVVVDVEARDERHARILNLTENLVRNDLTILDEANTLRELKDQGLDQFEIADRIGKSRGWVQVRSMLLDMPKEIQFEAALGIFSERMLRDLYTIYKREGKITAFGAVRKIKEAKRRGEKVTIVRRTERKRPTTKKARTKKDLIALNELILETLGESLATRALAWATGGISDYALHSAIQKLANDRGIEYELPFSDEDWIGNKYDPPVSDL